MTKKLILFDVDGTLTIPRNKICPEMTDILRKLNKIPDIELGFVGGSDIQKQIEQLGKETLELFPWKFTENGLKSYKHDILFHSKNIIEYWGEDKYQYLINTILQLLAEIKLPCKRGNFIELRTGMINVSPIGRSCSQKERDEFEQFDKEYEIRKKLISQIKKNMGEISDDITFSIGGQISMDIFPRGWEKTYCLQFVEKEYEEIYFFGDKTNPGGNDYEIYQDSRVKGYSVKTYQDTIRYLEELFLKFE